MPNETIREVVATGLGQDAVSVLCDSSATVTVRMKDDKKLRKDTIQKVFAESSNETAKRWKPNNFERSVRSPAVAAYEVQYSGGT